MTLLAPLQYLRSGAMAPLASPSSTPLRWPTINTTLLGYRRPVKLNLNLGQSRDATWDQNNYKQAYSHGSQCTIILRFRRIGLCIITSQWKNGKNAKYDKNYLNYLNLIHKPVALIRLATPPFSKSIWKWFTVVTDLLAMQRYAKLSQ